MPIRMFDSDSSLQEVKQGVLPTSFALTTNLIEERLTSAKQIKKNVGRAVNMSRWSGLFWCTFNPRNVLWHMDDS